MSIESLKQQARRHEQDEEWHKALEQYQKAIQALEREEQTDIGLVNRVGDLFVRVGKLDQAVRYYDQAVDLYREAFLPNNAIAVCKKIIRNVPRRHQVYLKIGQIRAEQGFLPDARTNFLTYAERMQREGNLDESFRALVEFCDLAPDEVEMRVTVADQMAASQRTDDAVEQLLVAYRHLTHSGEGDLAKGIEKKILALDPTADLAAALAAAATTGVGTDGESEFGEIDLGGGIEPEPFEEVSEELKGAAERFLADSEKGFGPAEEPEEDEVVAGWGDEAEGEEEEDFELPMISFDAESSEEDEGAELPMMSFDAEEEAEAEEAVGLPTFGVGEEEAEEEAVDLPTFDVDEERAAAVAFEEAQEEVAAETRREAPARPEPAPSSRKEEPQAPAEGYVDLGAMILGGASAKKTTRFTVAYEEPTGDEEADFAKMLSQFKEKVSENIEAGDVRAHYDLGTAYKEMGLLEEAISAFQQALRASSDHLPTYEVMGQTFIEMGQPDAAVRTLQRALKIHSGVEDEFVGIYYYLARAYEALDKKETAVEYYDRVFSLDINFADATERLRELR
jgi:tetratricopeptide (TPR) repeat protein